MREERIMVERRSSNWKKYAGYGLTAFLVIAAAVLLVFLFVKSEAFSEKWSKLTSVLAPVVTGALLAYLMNPLMIFFEKRLKTFLYKRAKKMSRANSIARAISIVLTLIVVIMLVVFLVYMLAPELKSTIRTMIDEAPKQARNLEEWYWGLELEKTVFSDYIDMAIEKGYAYVEDFVDNKLADTATKVVGSVATGIWSVLGTIYNIVLGLIFSVYFLASKENLAALSKKILYAIFKRKKANTIVRIARACHHKFIDSIVGKIVDSIIVGLICFVVMLIMGLPYASLISVLVGVTNVIPFFGPYMGAIPSALLILFVNPIQSVYFLIMIVVLQQIDCNILTPKIVGDTVGLSPFWVLFACVFFGGLYGIMGMLLGVPIMACIYMIIKEIVEDRLHAKGLKTDTTYYQYLEYEDETEMFCKVVDTDLEKLAAAVNQAGEANQAELTAKPQGETSEAVPEEAKPKN